MSIYGINGNELSICFNKSSVPLSAAYSVDGEQVFPGDGVRLKVMTYNVQYFNGINSQPALQTAIIDKYEPDIIGMQELGTYTVSTLPAVGQTMLADYAVKQLSNHKNKIMIVVKESQLSNLVIADFQHQDPEDLSRFNETRAYMKADVEIGGKTITLINTHLCYITESVKWQQMQELFTIAEQCDYCIITGDFNSMQMSEEAGDYINMYKPFVDAGYNLANNSPAAGFHNTYAYLTNPTSLADLQTAPDSIIVSSNIEITDVVFDPTKLSYLNGDVIDHIPVVAELLIH